MDEKQTQRAIRHRAWCTKSNQWLNPAEHYLALDGRGVVYNYDDLGCGVLGADIGRRGVIVEQFTGLKDKNEVDVFEGDIVLISPLRGKVSLEDCAIERYDDLVVFRPLVENPPLDIVYARAVVEWNPCMLQWRCRYIWTCKEWGGGRVGTPLGGEAYAFTIVENVHQHPELLANV